ncbi:MAG: glycosyltransferase family 2 protein [Rhodoferax sp.]|nr:glycosyltransferase family 2 protein [Rhodoferax sp.]
MLSTRSRHPARALRSVAEQHYPNDALYVIIVDDGSPVSAETELKTIPPPDGLRVKVLRQSNAGPNEARNTALQNLEAGTRVVAYLDSDDEWIGQHLDRAVHALSCGFTAYFANLFHLGDTTDEFAKAKGAAYRPPFDWRRRVATSLPRRHGASDLHRQHHFYAYVGHQCRGSWGSQVPNGAPPRRRRLSLLDGFNSARREICVFNCPGSPLWPRHQYVVRQWLGH